MIATITELALLRILPFNAVEMVLGQDPGE
jgi:hypothetical protein